MKGLRDLASTPPGEYLKVNSNGELVVSILWKELRKDGILDSTEDSVAILDQILDLFDVAVDHRMCSLIMDAFQEVRIALFPNCP